MLLLKWENCVLFEKKISEKNHTTRNVMFYKQVYGKMSSNNKDPKVL